METKTKKKNTHSKLCGQRLFSGVWSSGSRKPTVGASISDPFDVFVKSALLERHTCLRDRVFFLSFVWMAVFSLSRLAGLLLLLRFNFGKLLLTGASSLDLAQTWQHTAPPLPSSLSLGFRRRPR